MTIEPEAVVCGEWYSDYEISEILKLTNKEGRLLFKRAWGKNYVAYKCIAIRKDGQCTNDAVSLGGKCKNIHGGIVGSGKSSSYRKNKRSKESLDRNRRSFFDNYLDSSEREAKEHLRKNMTLEDKLQETTDMAMIILARCQDFKSLLDSGNADFILSALDNTLNMLEDDNPNKTERIAVVRNYLVQQTIMKGVNDLLKNIATFGNVTKDYSETSRFKKEVAALWGFISPILEIANADNKPEEQKKILQHIDYQRKILHQNLAEAYKANFKELEDKKEFQNLKENDNCFNENKSNITLHEKKKHSRKSVNEKGE